MSTNKLYIFSKDTDAYNSQRGYNYQTLKTLETWIQNFIDGKKEDIYCEYEEDIFQKDELNKSVRFRQIKLYSSSFSFNSDEIKKCISHFFMLHIKSDYDDFNKEFVFETNSTIAKKYLNNDAEILRDWFENQSTLNNRKLKIYSKKVKEIVTEYIKQQKGKIDENVFKDAIDILKKIKNPFWHNFTKTIRWQFIGTSPEEEFTSLKHKIEELIFQLPYEIDKNDLKQVFGVLLENIFIKVTETDYEKRKLTSDELENIILNIGSEEDKWYSKRYEYYKELESIEEFRIGEFYEILDLVNYCRRKKYLHRHKNLWNSFVIYYSRNESLNAVFRRKAIYEMIFLNNEFYEVDYEKLDSRIRPVGSLVGYENDIRYYFIDFVDFKSALDLENAQIILNIVFGAVENKKVEISHSELRAWLVKIYRKINQKLLIEKDVNERCDLLEQKGNLLLGINRLRKNSNIEFIQYFEQILDLADNAPLFKLSQFGDRIEKYIKMHLNIDPNDEMSIINALENFSEKLFPLVNKREGKSQLAKLQITRGYSYLKTNEPFNLLKALDYFHKAKDNYLQEDTIEGYILALLNIAQLYNAIGMHFAAKYYALGAYRMSINKEFLKLTEKSLAMLFYSDYKQGSWFMAINIYSRYISLRLASNFDKDDFEEEGHITQRLSLILYFMNRSSIQYKYFVDDYTQHLDYIGEEIIKPIHSKIDFELKSEENYLSVILKEFDDFPLNDVDKTREINFYALGSLWNIKFDNNYKLTAIAEEYISSIQIVLAEVALSNIDFHLLKTKIELELVISEEYLPPEQLPSNDVIKWKIPICYFDGKDAIKIKEHTVFNIVSLMQIIDTISLLKRAEFKKLFWNFVQERQLDTKQSSVNLYQKIHRDIYTKEDLDSFNSKSFIKEKFDLKQPKENIVMKWKDSLSDKYDKEFSIQAIKNRFNNTYKCIYLTLNKLKTESDFADLIINHRNEGWKDWQIIITIHNFILNYKIRLFEKKEFISNEDFSQHMHTMMKKYSKLDEKDCYVKFPIEAFKSEEFENQFDVGLTVVLITFGLETKLVTPNFKAIKEFLDIRFNVKNDEYDENNPLRDII